jgi:K+-sensing histidine kinase KdpD
VKVVTMLKFETSSKTQKDIQKFKEKFKGKNFTTSLYYDWNKQAGIRHLSDNVNADMIVLGTHGKHGLANFFNGRIAENLVNHSSLPVLTVNIHRKKFENQPNIHNAERISNEDYYHQGHIPVL